MSYFMKKHNREYKRRNKGKYINLSARKPKSTKTGKKLISMAKAGAKVTAAYFQGANEGLDSALGIPKREPDYVLAKIPKRYKIVKKRKATIPKGYKLVKMRRRR